LWGLSAVKDKFDSYGIHAAAFGRALGDYLGAPHLFLPRERGGG
jgi:hypothetical protein